MYNFHFLPVASSVFFALGTDGGRLPVTDWRYLLAGRRYGIICTEWLPGNLAVRQVRSVFDMSEWKKYMDENQEDKETVSSLGDIPIKEIETKN